MKQTLILLALLLSAFLLPAQNWSTMAPDLFPAERMQKAGVQVANIYQTTPDKEDGAESGQTFRVVKEPWKVLEFDRQGHNIHTTIYNLERGGKQEEHFFTYDQGLKIREKSVTYANRNEQIAMEWDIHYGYDDEGRKSSRVAYVVNATDTIPNDSVHFHYNYKGELVREEIFKFYLKKGDFERVYTYQDEMVTVTDPYQRIFVTLGNTGQFLSSKIVTEGTPFQTKSEFGYRDGLWTTLKSYTRKAGEDWTALGNEERFYNNRDLLVLTRMEYSSIPAREEAVEYFYFDGKR